MSRDRQVPDKTPLTGLRISLTLIGPLLLLLMLGHLLAPHIARADPDTYYVSPTGDDDNDCRTVAQACRTVQAAIGKAAPNDEVYVAHGAYTDVVGTVAWITKSLFLQGGWNPDFTENDPAIYPTRLDARHSGPVVILTGVEGEEPITPTVEGFILTNGDGTGVEGCVGLSGEPAGGCGGGVFGRYAAPQILNNVITDNVATRSGVGYGGGICLEGGGGTGVISGNTVISNVAALSSTGTVTGYGGGINLLEAPAIIQQNDIVNNRAAVGTGFGGGIAIHRCTGTILSNTIQGNLAAFALTDDILGAGGGMYVWQTRPPFSLPAVIGGNQLHANVASIGGRGAGGGITLLNAEATISGNWIVSNTSALSSTQQGDGGGIFATEDVTAVIENNHVLSNTSSTGGRGFGGGLQLEDSHVTVEDNWVAGNVASRATSSHLALGGGINLLRCDGIVRGNRVEGNAAAIDPIVSGYGGGINVRIQPVDIDGNTVLDNVATRWGGGVRVDRASVVRVSNNVIVGNIALVEGDGIHVSGSELSLASALVAHNTLVHNNDEGVCASGFATISLVNNILVSHTVSLVNAGAPPTTTFVADYNMLVANDEMSIGPVTITHPLIGAPSFVDPGNGDYHIRLDSDALDAGTSTWVSTDIDGDPRPCGSAPDVGVDEICRWGVELGPDQVGLAPPDQIVFYQYTLTNTGNYTDQFGFDVDSSNGWSAGVIPFSIILGGGASGTLEIWLSVPEEVLSGTVETTQVTAHSQVNGAISDTAFITTTIQHVPGVRLNPDREGSGLPGEEVVYGHTIVNTGNYTDTFSLEATSSEGWMVAVEPPLPVEMGPGSEGTVVVTVTIPSDALSDTVDTTTVTATSQSDGTVYDLALDCTTVQQVLGVQFAPDASGSGLPGSGISYVHLLTNTGNSTDTFEITPLSSEGWSVAISPSSSLQVGPWGTQTVNVMVSIPGDALSDTVDTTTVVAVSQADGSVSDSLVDTTIVGLLYAPPDLDPPAGFDIADPDETAVFTHTLFNNSNVIESFTLDALSPHGWPIAVSTLPPVPAFSAATVVLSVTVPGDASGGLSDTVALTATGAGGVAVAQDTVQVRAVAGVSLAPDHEVDAAAGETILFTHTLTNLGNITDTFALLAVSDHGWSAVSHPSSVTLPVSGTTTISVTITIPGDVAGLTDTTWVTATSQAQPGVVDTAQDRVTVTVTSYRLYLPLIRRE